MKVFQKGFNFSQDGPGNRLVYHLSGCNMRCIWCSNPEGMKGNRGNDYTPDDILLEAESAKMMFFSGGGVTFTGGEATLWCEELLKTLKLLKKAGINTAIETNGTSEKLTQLLPYIDYLIMDFKHFDSDVLKKYTGVGNEQVRKNFETICAMGRQLHIRIPLICGINAYGAEKYAEYFSGFNTENVVFEFLAYHEYGKDKWEEEYKVSDGFVSEEILDEFRKTFCEYNLKLITT